MSQTPEILEKPHSPVIPQPEQLNFCLLHGSWHGAWCWEHVQALLQEAGHSSQAPDLPLEQEATYDELADFVSSGIQDEQNTVLVVTSRAGNLAPRVASNLSLRQVIYVCSGFDGNAAEVSTGFNPFLRKLPKKYSKNFVDGIILDSTNKSFSSYDPEKAREIFYHDCDSATQDKAIERLKKTYRHKTDQPVDNWPEVPVTFVMANEDRVYNPAYSKYIAKRWLGVKAVRLSGGHCPYLSRPSDLTGALLSVSKSISE